MTIFLIRHGESHANKDTKKYELDGDSNITLTDTGWEQAISAGKFIKNWQERKNNGDHKKTHIWMSPYERTRETTSGLQYGAGKIDIINVAEELIEQDFGDYFALEQQRKSLLNLEFRKSSDLYEKAWSKDKFYARPPRGESPHDVQTRVKPFADMLRNHPDADETDHICITHGVTLRVFAMAFMRIDPKRYKEFLNPSNCAIFAIEGDAANGYSLKQIYDGETGEEIDIDWGEKLKAGKAILPPVPKKFIQKPGTPSSSRDVF
ncbi:MAG: hypothetical protein CO093_03410 [Alphaproteobacteria bacterium CG_4_9_14_3_um_filter_47_13]|nr:MAG: hypothetical protein CO093_03410 [Alphaproteobacteria bacterium CG_4_9_14_3_um_filter_47_13]